MQNSTHFDRIHFLASQRQSIDDHGRFAEIRRARFGRNRRGHLRRVNPFKSGSTFRATRRYRRLLQYGCFCLLVSDCVEAVASRRIDDGLFAGLVVLLFLLCAGAQSLLLQMLQENRTGLLQRVRIGADQSWTKWKGVVAGYDGRVGLYADCGLGDIGQRGLIGQLFGVLGMMTLAGGRWTGRRSNRVAGTVGVRRVGGFVLVWIGGGRVVSVGIRPEGGIVGRVAGSEEF